MTPEQKIKWAILLKGLAFSDVAPPENVNAENIDELFDTAQEDDNTSDGMQEARNEVREGQIETGLEAEWSRHYESKSVAAQMPDGTWVGWTYWYGGGKHGEPEAIDWMEDAYDLECAEEEKTLVVRTFKKI